MVTIEKAKDGLVAFIAGDVLPAMPNGMGKFLAYTAVAAAKQNPDALMRPYMPALRAVGVVSEDGGQVDDEALETALRDAFGKMPELRFAGFRFTSADVDSLLKHMRG